MQVHGSTYRTITHCAQDVFRNEGLRAFYVSYPTTLCMTVPFTATQFMAYESLSKAMNPSRGYDPITHCVAGGLAGGVAAGITTPLDVIKTLLQTRGTSNDAQIRNCKGLWEAASIIKERNGFGGFFRGLKPRIVTTMPSTAICWLVAASRHVLRELFTDARAGRPMRWLKRTSSHVAARNGTALRQTRVGHFSCPLSSTRSSAWPLQKHGSAVQGKTC